MDPGWFPVWTPEASRAASACALLSRVCLLSIAIRGSC